MVCKGTSVCHSGDPIIASKAGTENLEGLMESAMEWHIRCDAKDISRYVFCPGDQARARKIAEHMDDAVLVSDSRSILVMSGHYQGTFMTVCGTGMGGPVVAIALEELAHMGANTFIRVGACGVFQDGQKPGD